jgi:hypothetical protein
MGVKNAWPTARKLGHCFKPKYKVSLSEVLRALHAQHDAGVQRSEHSGPAADSASKPLVVVDASVL